MPNKCKRKEIVIFGAGGHARETLQLLHDINNAGENWQVVGLLVDADFRGSGEVANQPVFEADNWLAENQACALSVAVGTPTVRRDIVRRIVALGKGFHFPCLIHPQSWVANSATLGAGTTVFAGSQISVDTQIGEHVAINLGTSISHDVRIGDFCNLGPGSHLPGRVTLGDGVDLGTASCAIPGISIGDWAVVGAGSVLTRNIAPGMLAKGVPARACRRA